MLREIVVIVCMMGQPQCQEMQFGMSVGFNDPIDCAIAAMYDAERQVTKHEGWSLKQVTCRPVRRGA
jgi:hypothetical protein